MSIPKESSSMRYFWASLKPLGRPLFWLPLGILSLSLIGYWQYQQNPTWLNPVREQPIISIDENDVKSDRVSPQAGTPPGIPPSDLRIKPANRPATDESLDSVDPVDLTTNGLFPSLTTKTNKNPQKPSSSLFLPLLPSIKQNSGYSSPKSLQPIQISPDTDNSNNYPLQTAIDNLSRSSANPNPVTPIDRPNQVPTITNSTPPTINPTYPGGSQPNSIGYPNQGPQSSMNTNPYQVPTQTPNQGYTVQPPIDGNPYPVPQQTPNQGYTIQPPISR